MNLSKKFVLIIVDGVGINDKIDNNAFKLAKTPTFDKLFSKSPWTTLGASEEFVGLPKGISGNSEIPEIRNSKLGAYSRESLCT